MSTLRALLFQLSTLVTQMTPSISIPLFAMFSSSNGFYLSYLLENRRVLVILYILSELR